MSLCEYCKSRYSWDCDDGLAYPDHGCENFTLDYCTLTDEQKANNKEKSKVRVRIEHIFGFMTMSMHGITLRSIGKQRADFNIGFSNLVYNICRTEILSRVAV